MQTCIGASEAAGQAFNASTSMIHDSRPKPLIDKGHTFTRWLSKVEHPTWQTYPFQACGLKVSVGGGKTYALLLMVGPLRIEKCIQKDVQKLGLSCWDGLPRFGKTYIESLPRFLGC